jgi:hypothetical protein
MSITDGSFKLPIIEALAPHTSFSTGANKPLLITGVDEDGNKGDYVVKFIGAQRMSKEACMRELLAALIAIQMKIKVTKPVVVNISEAFVDLLRGQDSWEYASKSLGYNYGSEYIRSFTTILPTQELTPQQVPFAQTIFPFDVTIQNPDRTNEKPNMMTDGTEIVIYDHELAFSFVFDIFPNSEPWKVQLIDMEWIKKHILFLKVKGLDFDFDGFIKRFDNLDEKFWETAKTIIPQEWFSDQFDKIKQHFTIIYNNKEAFIIELKKLMS